MNKKMLIDASYKEETRVVILDNSIIEDYDVESATKKQIKGNIYLAKVIRIEPSLQAAFIDYGGNKHGFLAFSEIHPDYYQIPVADRNKILAIQNEQQDLNRSFDNSESDENEDAPQIFDQLYKNYKIQEVIHKRQILLVQVVKEERGNKGAALTTYLSLAGRYCVLMPNSMKSGGISRKITSPSERRRLKDIISELNIPSHMGMIVRTAGAQCSKPDALRDGEYLLRLWNDLRDRTLKSIAPTLIYEDSSLLKRAIRDNYTSDINEILIDGEESWTLARDYMRALMPQNVRKLHLWRDQKQSLFSHYKVENLIDQMLSPIVQLKSGGYLVINQTEALVAIDVNSGRSIKERDLEDTALRTNQEAADEVVRQLRLRDLAGLIVIDFIDMENKKHNFMIERRLKNALGRDRARIQVGSISTFGLLEMTRQRLRPSIAEFAFMSCSHCNGTGIIRSVENIALHILRQIDGEARHCKPGLLTVHLSSHEIALFILNLKRQWLMDMESKYKLQIILDIDTTLQTTQIKCHHEIGEITSEPETELETDKIDYLLTDNPSIREIPIQSQPELSDQHNYKEQNNRKKHFKRSKNDFQRSGKDEISIEPITNSSEEPILIPPIKLEDTVDFVQSETIEFNSNNQSKSNTRHKYSSRFPRQPRWKRHNYDKPKDINTTEPSIVEISPIEAKETINIDLTEHNSLDNFISSTVIDAEFSDNLITQTSASSNQIITITPEPIIINEVILQNKNTSNQSVSTSVSKRTRRPRKKLPTPSEDIVDLASIEQPAIVEAIAKERVSSVGSINSLTELSTNAQSVSLSEHNKEIEDAKIVKTTEKAPTRRRTRAKKKTANPNEGNQRVSETIETLPPISSTKTIDSQKSDKIDIATSPNTNSNYQPIQPIVIDETIPSSHQKSGWWKR